MRKQAWPAWGAVLGALTGIAAVGLSYLAQQWAGLPFFPFVLFDGLARVLPGGIITLAIGSMVRLIVALHAGSIDVVAKGMEQAFGILLWLALSIAFGAALAAWIQRHYRKDTGQQAGAVAGIALAVLVLLAMIGLRDFGASQPWTLLWLAILVPGWGAVLGTLLERMVRTELYPAESGVAPTESRTGRRAFLLRAGGGSVVLALLAAGLGRLLAEDRARTGAGRPLGELQAQAAAPLTPAAPEAGSSPVPSATPVLPEATPAGRIEPAPGTRPEITSNANFYRIDIDLLPAQISGSSWQLQVSGLFDRPRNLTLQDLAAMPAVTQPITQSCISNPIGGDLISSAYYTGVRFHDVLQELGLRPEAKEVALHSADGFYESVATQDLSDPRVLLVYGMNGQTLPVEHGYPLRIYIPNRYGMKQPKWIISMQAIDRPGPGYWVDRGWSAEARPQVISIIDTVAKDQIQNGRVPIGGIAWAGDRGIKSVEVQVDGSEWAEATLRTPPIGALTWVQWRYDWPVVTGRHVFRVRATDGKGAQQIGQEQDTYPNGATGYHAVTVVI